MRGWKNIVHTNGKLKKAGLATLISEKIDLKIKNITRDKEGHYLMIKVSIQEEDITIVNIYAPNIGAPQYIRQTLTDIKGETDRNTRIVGDFNTPGSSDGKSVCLQCRRPEFDPWVGKIPWRRKWQPTPSILAWKIPWTEEPGRLQSMGSQRVGHDWATSLSLFLTPHSHQWTDHQNRKLIRKRKS